MTSLEFHLIPPALSSLLAIFRLTSPPPPQKTSLPTQSPIHKTCHCRYPANQSSKTAHVFPLSHIPCWRCGSYVPPPHCVSRIGTCTTTPQPGTKTTTPFPSFITCGHFGTGPSIQFCHGSYSVSISTTDRFRTHHEQRRQKHVDTLPLPATKTGLMSRMPCGQDEHKCNPQRLFHFPC